MLNNLSKKEAIAMIVLGFVMLAITQFMENWFAAFTTGLAGGICTGIGMWNIGIRFTK